MNFAILLRAEKARRRCPGGITRALCKEQRLARARVFSRFNLAWENAQRNGIVEGGENFWKERREDSRVRPEFFSSSSLINYTALSFLFLPRANSFFLLFLPPFIISSYITTVFNVVLREILKNERGLDCCKLEIYKLIVKKVTILVRRACILRTKLPMENKMIRKVSIVDHFEAR